MLSLKINATEHQDTATADIIGAFLQTDYDKGDININMEREMVNLIKEIYPDYYKDFIYIYTQRNAYMQNPRRLYTAL